MYWLGLVLSLIIFLSFVLISQFIFSRYLFIIISLLVEPYLPIGYNLRLIMDETNSVNFFLSCNLQSYDIIIVVFVWESVFIYISMIAKVN
jgi:hypothetical protein